MNKFVVGYRIFLSRLSHLMKLVLTYKKIHQAFKMRCYKKCMKKFHNHESL